MLANALRVRSTSHPSFEEVTPGIGIPSRPAPTTPTAVDKSPRAIRPQSEKLAGAIPALVDVTPHGVVTRRGVSCRGMEIEFVHATRQERIECSFQSPVHLLVAYERGMRHDGETFVEGLPKSALRDVARKFTLAPAGHEYRERYDLRTQTNLMYFYFDPDQVQADPESSFADMPLTPRLFFEDATLWDTMVKLKKAFEGPRAENRLYVEALGVVLVHELIRLNRSAPMVEANVRGGLAAWQQRIATAYIDEHLSKQISLATLAQLVRLSRHYFCRAFKQSFGLPPHRYQINRRIERAKTLLAGRKHSVTEIGLMLGYSEASAFTAAFRNVTGLTPSSYHRSLI
jgi:AraC family transcriptional regulator